jgi:hypothetical protein
MNREATGQWRRRGFLGGALVAAGAAAGWVVRRLNGPPAQLARTTTAPDDRFVYDVSEFEKTDPALLLYEPAGAFDTRMAQVRRMTDWRDRGIVVAGDELLCLFDADGSLGKSWPLDRTPHCLLALNGDELMVGSGNRFQVFDSNGKSQFSSAPFGPKTYLTSIAVHEDRLFAADAGNREVVVCERQTGRVLDRFGKKDSARGNPGFNVPSPYFALGIGSDGMLRVVNPGMLRVETYTLDGRFVSAWGQPGMRIDRFCGCCNPVYFALTPAGDFITSEKGLARINVYAADGSFKGAVAGPDTLVTDKELARRACVDCTVGSGFDVALAANGDVLALDPYSRTVRRFQPKQPT